jgi:hypothetical protein
VILTVVAATQALTGDNQHGANTVRMRAAQKPQQRSVRLRLRHAVQIETRFDRFASTRNTLLQPAVEWCKRR